MQKRSGASGGLRVACKQTKCIHFQKDPEGQVGWCLCKHPEKHLHREHPCPLYRMDWKATGIMEMF